MQTALTNVCFQWKNGRDANGPLCLLLTQSGHVRARASLKASTRCGRNKPDSAWRESDVYFSDIPAVSANHSKANIAETVQECS
jgi:hypothetical protein